jgi:formylglycine-generating enzyme required for sulfatase activity
MQKIIIKTAKPKRNFLKPIFGGLIIIILSTLGINAADNFGDMSNSIIGRLLNGNSRCPSDMVLVTSSSGGFCIDKFENSTNDKCPHANPNELLQSQTNINAKDCQAVSEAEKLPWINITQEQAMRACAKAGKRLPTNAEWQAAALGTPDKNSDWNEDDCQVANNWAGQPGNTGSGKNCTSFVGAYDMIGNVWEWIDGAIEDGKFNGRDLPTDGYIQNMNMNDDLPGATADKPSEALYNDYFWMKNTKTRGILRGGYWANKADAGQYAIYAVFTPDSSGGTTGFRCVK